MNTWSPRCIDEKKGFSVKLKVTFFQRDHKNWQRKQSNQSLSKNTKNLCAGLHRPPRSSGASVNQLFPKQQEAIGFCVNFWFSGTKKHQYTLKAGLQAYKTNVSSAVDISKSSVSSRNDTVPPIFERYMFDFQAM